MIYGIKFQLFSCTLWVVENMLIYWTDICFGATSHLFSWQLLSGSCPIRAQQIVGRRPVPPAEAHTGSCGAFASIVELSEIQIYTVLAPDWMIKPLNVFGVES